MEVSALLEPLLQRYGIVTHRKWQDSASLTCKIGSAIGSSSDDYNDEEDDK